MALIEKLVGKVIRKGRLTLIMPDSRKHRIRPGGGKQLTVRVTDNKAAFAIARNPRLGLGEAYMDGRIIDRGRRHPRPDAAGRPARTAGRTAGRRQGRSARASKPSWKALFRAKPREARAAAMSPTITTSATIFYRLFLDDDMQYSCAYFTDPTNSLEQAQLDKKAHIAAKLDLEAGTACAGHRLRLGRDGALPEPRRWRPSHSA